MSGHDANFVVTAITGGCHNDTYAAASDDNSRFQYTDDILSCYWSDRSGLFY